MYNMNGFLLLKFMYNKCQFLLIHFCANFMFPCTKQEIPATQLYNDTLFHSSKFSLHCYVSCYSQTSLYHKHILLANHKMYVTILITTNLQEKYNDS